MNGSPLVIDRAEQDDRAEFKDAVLAGLEGTPRAIPAKFLYDARGSALFDAICELPEYYLTRTETDILRRSADDIATMAGPGCALVEFGSGSSVKSRLLIEAMRDLAAYVPIDISRQHLDATATRLRRDYPGLNVEPVCADYMALTRLPEEVSAARRRIGFFPGSTIGNLLPVEATAFLRRARGLLGEGGALVLGVDLKKDPRRLHDAYNDAAGVTAQFTLNLLRRMNRELDANFDLSGFAHEAFYNPTQAADRHGGWPQLRLPGRRTRTHRIFLQVRRCGDRPAGAQRRIYHRADLDRSGEAVRRRLSGDPLKQAARPRVSSGTGYRSSGESGIAERGQGDTGYPTSMFTTIQVRRKLPTSPKKLIQSLSI